MSCFLIFLSCSPVASKINVVVLATIYDWKNLTSTDQVFVCTNVDDLERPWTPKIWVWSEFFAILGCDSHLWFSLKYTGDRPRQPAYEIKLMLSRAPWALAHISCLNIFILFTCCFKEECGRVGHNVWLEGGKAGLPPPQLPDLPVDVIRFCQFLA